MSKRVRNGESLIQIPRIEWISELQTELGKFSVSRGCRGFPVIETGYRENLCILRIWNEMFSRQTIWELFCEQRRWHRGVSSVLYLGRGFFIFRNTFMEKRFKERGGMFMDNPDWWPWPKNYLNNPINSDNYCNANGQI